MTDVSASDLAAFIYLVENIRTKLSQREFAAVLIVGKKEVNERYINVAKVQRRYVNLLKQQKVH